MSDLARPMPLLRLQMCNLCGKPILQVSLKDGSKDGEDGYWRPWGGRTRWPLTDRQPLFDFMPSEIHPFLPKNAQTMGSPNFCPKTYPF